MSPKQKAEELVDKMLYCYQGHIDKYTAKQCALIAVDEMIVQNGELYLNQLGEKALQFYIKNNHFLFEVKQEIEKL